MYSLLKFLTRLIQLMPISVLYFLSISVSRLIFFFLPAKRDNMRRNYRAVLGPGASAGAIDNTVWKNIDNYARFSAEFLYLDKLVKQKNINPDIDGAQYIHEGLSRGKGHIMCTLHFGNWDIAGAIISQQFKQKVWAVADDLGGGYSRFIQDTRKNYGIEIILPNKNLKDVYTSLAGNAILNVLIDRPVAKSDPKAVEIEFMGKKAYVASLAGRIIVKSGAAVTLGIVIRTKDGFKGMCSPLIDYKPTGNTDEDVRIVTQAVMKEAEKFITKYPEEWYMFRYFFAE